MTGALAGKTIKDIASNNYNASGYCVIASDDRVYCWGAGFYGALGNGSTAASSVPVAVNLNKDVTKIVHNLTNSCAVTSQNELYCWGTNSGAGSGTPILKTLP